MTRCDPRCTICRRDLHPLNVGSDKCGRCILAEREGREITIAPVLPAKKQQRGRPKGMRVFVRRGKKRPIWGRVSALALNFPCPTCSAVAHEPCTTKSNKLVTGRADIHKRRRDMARRML